MAKKIAGFIKLQIPAGKANPSPPVGPALGQKGVNIIEFGKQFNARTTDKEGLIIPVVITVYSDKSFTFITKTPPAAILLLRAAKLEKGSAESHRAKASKVQEALDAGADYAGFEEYLEKIKTGWADVDVIVATPDSMGELGKLGKVLGPKGLMPNPKSGTVTMDVANAVKEVKAGT